MQSNGCFPGTTIGLKMRWAGYCGGAIRNHHTPSHCITVVRPRLVNGVCRLYGGASLVANQMRGVRLSNLGYIVTIIAMSRFCLRGIFNLRLLDVDFFNCSSP